MRTREMTVDIEVGPAESAPGLLSVRIWAPGLADALYLTHDQAAALADHLNAAVRAADVVCA